MKKSIAYKIKSIVFGAGWFEGDPFYIFKFALFGVYEDEFISILDFRLAKFSVQIIFEKGLKND
jgi:hypothetical protein